MSSLPPDQARDLSIEEVRALYPSDLTLKYVQLFFRHGERTPVRQRLVAAGIPPFWNVCKAAGEFRGTALLPTSEFRSLHYRRKVEEPEADGRLKKINATGEGYCLLGELTDQGRLSTTMLGQRIRKLYIDQLGFLPSTLENEDTIYMRTSHIQRTIESLTQVFTGLYPRDKATAVPNFHLRLVHHENLYPNDDFCARLKKLSEDYSVKAAKEWDPKLKISSQVLQKWIPDGISVNGRPKATGILDTINSSLANGISLPPELMDEPMRRDVEDAAVSEWFNGYLENETYRRLGVGPLLGDVIDRFTFAATNTSSQKMALYGTHDTTIAALLATLGVFDNRWPCFTSNITFELFQEVEREPKGLNTARLFSLISNLFSKSTREPYDGYFVRMKYNRSVVSLPVCMPAGKHREGDESLCTLQAFKEAIDAVRPANWKEECRSIEAEKTPKYQEGAHQ